jgi:5'-deoxynucleotidase YfbR-like HD superfamily hydrolase
MSVAAFGCVKNTIRLRSGRYFDFIDPQPDQFTLGDIAGALSKICRFGGQVESFYSVAEHCVHCAEQARDDGLPLDTQVACLLHDAAEAFTGDIVKPLKIMLGEFKEIESRVESVIWEKFCIDFEREEISVRKIDHEMLIAERRQLFSPDKVTWFGENEVRALKRRFHGWFPRDAESLFVHRAREFGVSPIES